MAGVMTKAPPEPMKPESRPPTGADNQQGNELAGGHVHEHDGNILHHIAGFGMFIQIDQHLLVQCDVFGRHLLVQGQSHHFLGAVFFKKNRALRTVHFGNNALEHVLGRPVAGGKGRLGEHGQGEQGEHEYKQ